MKKFLNGSLLFAGMVTLLLSCNREPASYTVTGILPDSSANGKNVYLVDFDQNKKLDSTVINGNTFQFKGSIDSAVLSRIDINRMYANFILENGNITLDFNNHTGKGTLMNDKMAEMTTINDSLYNVADRFHSNLKTQNLTEQEILIKKNEYFEKTWRPEYVNYFKTIYDANKNNELGFYSYIIFQRYMQQDEHQRLLATADSSFLKKEIIQRMVKTLAAREKTAEGMMFTDFAIQTPDGGEIALSDYVGKGKYTLVDFWASWCKPCIGELPVIKEVYEKYKGKLNVVGVAVWDDTNATIKAVTEHKISWPQIINAQDTPTKLYGIDGIPHIILFGPDGTIIARGLRGDGLKKKIEEVMSK